MKQKQKQTSYKAPLTASFRLAFCGCLHQFYALFLSLPYQTL